VSFRLGCAAQSHELLGELGGLGDLSPEVLVCGLELGDLGN
jgi:hypothetical protein